MFCILCYFKDIFYCPYIPQEPLLLVCASVCVSEGSKDK